MSTRRAPELAAKMFMQVLNRLLLLSHNTLDGFGTPKLTNGLQIQITDLHNSDSSDGDTQHSKRTRGMNRYGRATKTGCSGENPTTFV